MNNIYLIGFMGCGKSFCGEMLASITGWMCYDTDEVFQQKTGLSTAEFICRDGLQVFRARERSIFRYFALSHSNCVVSTGGGLPLDPPNFEVMKNTGLIVWLSASFDTVSARIENDKTDRPVWLQRTPAERLELFNERQGLYSALANFTIDTNGNIGKGAFEPILKRIAENNAWHRL